MEKILPKKLTYRKDKIKYTKIQILPTIKLKVVCANNFIADHFFSAFLVVVMISFELFSNKLENLKALAMPKKSAVI
ncbi:MAG: hypothetical protein Q4Q13_06950 [Vagococcus sp.]|nr:hypothetical protein [Vagococcus sp.]